MMTSLSGLRRTSWTQHVDRDADGPRGTRAEGIAAVYCWYAAFEEGSGAFVAGSPAGYAVGDVDCPVGNPVAVGNCVGGGGGGAEELAGPVTGWSSTTTETSSSQEVDLGCCRGSSASSAGERIKTCRSEDVHGSAVGVLICAAAFMCRPCTPARGARCHHTWCEVARASVPSPRCVLSAQVVFHHRAGRVDGVSAGREGMVVTRGGSGSSSSTAFTAVGSLKA